MRELALGARDGVETRRCRPKWRFHRRHRCRGTLLVALCAHRMPMWPHHVDDLMPHLSSERTARPMGAGDRRASPAVASGRTSPHSCWCATEVATSCTRSRSWLGEPPDRRGRGAMRGDRVRTAAGGGGHARRDCARRAAVHRRVAGNSPGRIRGSTATASVRSRPPPTGSHCRCSSTAAAPIRWRAVACLPATIRRERRTTVWTSTQSHGQFRMSLVQLLGLDDEELRIITPDVAASAPRTRPIPRRCCSPPA